MPSQDEFSFTPEVTEEAPRSLPAPVPTFVATRPFFLVNALPEGNSVEYETTLRDGTLSRHVHFRIEIGGYVSSLARLRRGRKSDQPKPMPALNHRHAMLVVMAMRLMDKLDPSKPIDVSLKALAEMIYGATGGEQVQAVSELLADLWETGIRITDLNDPKKKQHELRILSSNCVETEAVVIDGVTKYQTVVKQIAFSPEFISFVANCGGMIELRADVLARMSSEIARTIYLYIPSRAIKHPNAANPFYMTLRTILGQIGCNVPPYKSQRLEKFVRARRGYRSVLEQIDRAELMFGRLRAQLVTVGEGAESKLVETEDGDYKIAFWHEVTEEDVAKRPARTFERGVLCRAYIAGGGSDEQYALATPEELDDYELQILKRLGIEWGSNKIFQQGMMKAKALLRPDVFRARLGDVAGSARSRTGVRFPANMLMGAMREALKAGLFKQPALASS